MPTQLGVTRLLLVQQLAVEVYAVPECVVVALQSCMCIQARLRSLLRRWDRDGLRKPLHMELRLAFEDGVDRMRQEVDGKYHTEMLWLAADQAGEVGRCTETWTPNCNRK